MTHTPERWEPDMVHKMHVVDIVRDVEGYAPQVVATVCGPYPDDVIRNARLIAAAPDMLEALEEVMGELDVEGLPCPLCGRDLTIGHRHNCIWHVVESAVRKARGEE